MQKDGKANEECHKTGKRENAQTGLTMKDLMERQEREGCIFKRGQGHR